MFERFELFLKIIIPPGGQGQVPKSGEVGPLTQPEQLANDKR